MVLEPQPTPSTSLSGPWEWQDRSYTPSWYIQEHRAPYPPSSQPKATVSLQKVHANSISHLRPQSPAQYFIVFMSGKNYYTFSAVFLHRTPTNRTKALPQVRQAKNIEILDTLVPDCSQNRGSILGKAKLKYQKLPLLSTALLIKKGCYSERSHHCPCL